MHQQQQQQVFCRIGRCISAPNSGTTIDNAVVSVVDIHLSIRHSVVWLSISISHMYNAIISRERYFYSQLNIYSVSFASDFAYISINSVSNERKRQTSLQNAIVFRRRYTRLCRQKTVKRYKCNKIGEYIVSAPVARMGLYLCYLFHILFTVHLMCAIHEHARRRRNAATSIFFLSIFKIENYVQPALMYGASTKR